MSDTYVHLDVVVVYSSRPLIYPADIHQFIDKHIRLTVIGRGGGSYSVYIITIYGCVEICKEYNGYIIGNQNSNDYYNYTYFRMR